MAQLIGYLSEGEQLQGRLSDPDRLVGELSIPAFLGGGLSEEVKQALLDLFAHLAYTDADGQDYYDALYNAFYPPAELTSISAVYTQSGSVFPDTPLDDLKDDLVVTAHYSDSTTEAVPSADYTLSGTLTVGTSTVTVSYEGKATTFNVTVSQPLPYTFYDYLTLTYELNANMAANDGILTDIAFAPNQTLETSIYYEGTISSACPIMGIREGQNGTKDFALFVTPSNGKCGYWYGGTDTTQGFLPFVRNQLNTVKVQPVGVSQTYPSNATLNINGTDYNTGSTTASGTWPSWLGFFKYGISATSTSTGVNDKYPKLRIGETIIKSGTTVLHDLKPAYHNTTQYYGFYDAVTDTFYYSERNNAHISAGDYT